MNNIKTHTITKISQNERGGGRKKTMWASFSPYLANPVTYWINNSTDHHLCQHWVDLQDFLVSLPVMQRCIFQNLKNCPALHAWYITGWEHYYKMPTKWDNCCTYSIFRLSETTDPFLPLISVSFHWVSLIESHSHRALFLVVGTVTFH